jgi:peptide/nickel transport system ATP-binding protein
MADHLRIAAAHREADAPTTLYELMDVERIYSISNGMFGAKQSFKALRGISLTVHEGEILGIVGESGCGKSTLAKILLGLAEPSDGVIQFQEKTLQTMPRKEFVAQVQPIFQDPFSALNPRKTVREIVTLPLKLRGTISAKEAATQAAELLERVGLPAYFMDRYPAQLSGGQRQRVAIARALITRPKVLICDEPTSALDVSVQAQILNLLMDLREQYKLTYIFISHNLSVIEHIATRVAVMYLGRIVELAPAEQLFSSPRHPYTRALLNSALSVDPELGVPESELDGTQPSPLQLPSGCAFHTRCKNVAARCLEHSPEPHMADSIVECHFPLN